VKGPDASARDASPTWVLGEAKDPSGRRQEIRISSLNWLFPDRFQLFGHRRAPHREWYSSQLLDAGRDHGEGLHLEPAGNIEAGIAALNRMAERSNDVFTFLVL
jgi:hypothetical protein